MTEHFFRNTLCAGHVATKTVDFFCKILGNRTCAVKNDGEVGKTSAYFF